MYLYGLLVVDLVVPSSKSCALYIQQQNVCKRNHASHERMLVTSSAGRSVPTTVVYSLIKTACMHVKQHMSSHKFNADCHCFNMQQDRV